MQELINFISEMKRYWLVILVIAFCMAHPGIFIAVLLIYGFFALTKSLVTEHTTKEIVLGSIGCLGLCFAGFVAFAIFVGLANKITSDLDEATRRKQEAQKGHLKERVPERPMAGQPSTDELTWRATRPQHPYPNKSRLAK